MPDSLRISEVANRAPVVTRHTMRLKGQTLAYTATAGMLPIRNHGTGAAEGYIFYVAYTKDGASEPATRPLTFVFNGGPGSSTVWLHMGAFGPKRVKLMPDGSAPPPPYRYEDNPYTLLDQTDLVFLDPVGTGYSRAAKPALGPNFWGLNEDIRATGEFIRLYLTRHQRWGSPLYLAGESYGTTRAAGLSGHLADQGITLNGIALISAVLNFQASRDVAGNDLAFINFIPSYAATAWFHKKLPADLQSQPLQQVVRQAEQWAEKDYAFALMRGSRLTAAERQAAVQQMARYTGLAAAYIDRSDLRVPLSRFNQELLRDQRLSVGRLDSRFTAYAIDGVGSGAGFDPSEASIRNTFTPVLNDYVRRELRYEDESLYYILGGGIGRWVYPDQQGFPSVTPALERAFAKNPYMKLYVAMGYYDMATPYFAVEHTLGQLSIDPKVQKNISTGYFEAGHMMYIDEGSMGGLREGMGKLIGR